MSNRIREEISVAKKSSIGMTCLKLPAKIYLYIFKKRGGFNSSPRPPTATWLLSGCRGHIGSRLSRNTQVPATLGCPQGSPWMAEVCHKINRSLFRLIEYSSPLFLFCLNFACQLPLSFSLIFFFILERNSIFIY